MKDRERVIWLAGPFPPPLHGQAIYNAAMAELLARRGKTRVLPAGDGAVGKLVAYARMVLAVLLRARQGDVVYASVPAHAATWLFAAVIAAVRFRRLPCYLHHHSSRPIVLGPTRVMRLIVALGGARQHHILLSPRMRDRFAALYLRDRGRAHALSNALLFGPDGNVSPPPRPERPPTIGHLSVLTREKGVDVVLRLHQAVAALRPGCRLVLAGPVEDASLEREIAAAVAGSGGRVDYRGVLVGEAKARFYADIDLFVFPTRLVDEAEPLVMLEAFAAGVDMVAAGRGCIPERLRASDRLLTGDDAVDAARIVRVLDAAAADWEGARAATRRHTAALHAAALDEAADLFATMLPPGIAAGHEQSYPPCAGKALDPER